MFDPQPPVATTSPDIAKSVWKFLNRHPDFRRLGVPHVTSGPTRASMSVMEESGLPLTSFAGTNLMGVTDRLEGRTKHEIGINPNHHPIILDDTVAHEFGHASGGGETIASLFGTAYQGALRGEPESKAQLEDLLVVLRMLRRNEKPTPGVQ
jgi:hypothetical protein